MTPTLYQRGQIPQIHDLLGIDYLTMTGPAVRVEALEGTLRTCFPTEPPRVAVGRRGYDWRLVWSSGAELNGGSRTGRYWLVLPGVACALLGLQRLYDLLTPTLCDPETTITRIDLRRDLRGESLTLLEDLEAACVRGELCRARRWKRFDEREAVGGTRAGYGIYLGSTASPVFVRAYDKGLESGESPAGTWVRFEAQLRDAHAHEATQRILYSGLERFASTAGSILCGVVDFREGDRDSVDNLNDLPQPEFWCRFLESFGASRLDLPPVDRCLSTWLEHLRRCYGGMIAAAAQALGTDAGTVAGLLLADAEPTPGTKKNPMLQPLCSWLRPQL